MDNVQFSQGKTKRPLLTFHFAGHFPTIQRNLPFLMVKNRGANPATILGQPLHEGRRVIVLSSTDLPGSAKIRRRGLGLLFI